MSNEDFEPGVSFDYERVHRGAKQRIRRWTWLRLFILFCILSSIFSTLWSRPYAAWNGAIYSNPWPIALLICWFLYMLIRRIIRSSQDSGDKLDDRIDRAVQREMRREAERAARYTEVDDLFEKTKRGSSDEKPKQMPRRVARLGDDGELIYEEESRSDQDGRGL